MSLIDNLDWNTILTSGVIAAVVAAFIEIFKTNNSNKASFVIKQREDWRKKIREISEEINTSNMTNIHIPLTKLQMRINPYGKKMIYTNDTTSNNSKEFFLNDGHIHSVMQKIEKTKEKQEFEQEKQKLIDYLSCLVKFDWERAKTESTINGFFLSALVIEAISTFLLFFYAKQYNLHVEDAIVYLVLCFASPVLIHLMLKDCRSTEKIIQNAKNIFIFILCVLIIVAICMVIKYNDLIISMLLMVLAYMVLIVSISNRERYIKDYLNAIAIYSIIDFDEQRPKNSDNVNSKKSQQCTENTNNIVDDTSKVLSKKSKVCKKIKYLIAPIRLIFHTVILLLSALWSLFDKIIDKEIETKNNLK